MIVPGTIKWQLTLAFISLVILFSIGSGVSFFILEQIGQTNTMFVSGTLPAVHAGNQLALAAQDMVILGYELDTAEDLTALRDRYTRFNQLHDSMAVLIAGMSTDDSEADLLTLHSRNQQIRTLTNMVYQLKSGRFMQSARREDQAAETDAAVTETMIESYLAQLSEQTHALASLSTAYAGLMTTQAETRALEVRSTYKQGRRIVISMLLLMGLLSIVIAWLYGVRRISKRLSVLSSAITQQDTAMVRTQITITGQDEIARMARAAESLLENRVELLNARSMLEKRIAERTRELRQEIKEHWQTEENARITLNSIGDAVIATDTDGMIIRMNPVAENLTGWRSAEAVGQPLTQVFTIVNALTGEKAIDPVSRALATREIVELANHTQLITKDGSKHQIADSAAPIRGPDGIITGVVLVFRDVTEEYLMREELRQNEERFRTLVENIPGVTYRSACDEHWTVEFISAAVELISGYPAADFLRNAVRSYASIIHPEDQQIVEDSVMERIEQKKPFTIEYRIVRADGAIRWMYEKGQGIFDKYGNIRYLDGVIVDITGRKQAEEEQRKSGEMLELVINNIPQAVFWKNRESVFLGGNKALAEIVGIDDPEDIVGKTDYDFSVTKENADFYGECNRRVMDADIAELGVEESLRRPDGSEMWLLINRVPLRDAEGRVMGILITFEDISERKRMQEMLIQSEKMLSVGGLAAGMAHEINNPLAGMMQTADVMSRRLTDLKIPANQRAAEEAGTSVEAIRAFMDARGIIKMLGNIRESGRRAAEIVQNMLSFARKSDAAFSTYSLADLLDQSVDLAGSDYDLKKKFDFRRIEIVREYEADLPYVACESGKIQQVFLNVLRNGAEAMQSEAEQHEDTTPRFVLRLAYEKEPAKVRIEIENNGPSMDEATRKRVFEPFFTTKAVGVGTGLGLSVSYFIITENHGGDMSVESTPGEGTTFIINLPVKRRQS
ncbi:MAG: PAS domain S-box protein [bacterium]|nr:PAS domain S-box protein [bacterium]